VLEVLSDADRAALDAVASIRAGWLSAVLVVVSAWWFKGLVITGLGGLADIRRRRPPWTMVAAGVAAGLAAAVTAGLKEAFDRARPSVADPGFQTVVPAPGSDAFPSGHAAEAFAAATLVGLLAPRLRLPALALAALVAFSRVYLGVHYPLDALAGALVGLAIGAGAALLLRRSVLPRARPAGAREAAPGQADVVRGAETADRPARRAEQALFHELADGRDERRMRSDGRRAHEADAELVGDGTRLDVEVVEHLDVVREEPERGEHDVLDAPLRDGTKVVADVGLEPGHLRGTAAALVHDGVIRNSDALGHEPRRLGELPLVATAAGHRERDRVRREGHVRPCPPGLRNPVER
jgi:undecaprenyl-diphosphatase